jgi:hypothetical protein
MTTDEANNILESCAVIADYFAEYHEFYDGGYQVGKKIAKRIRSLKCGLTKRQR